MRKKLSVLAMLGLATGGAFAQATPAVGDVVTAATTTFGAVAALCITIGTFFVGYRLVKRIK